MRVTGLLLVVVLLSGNALAQSSSSYQVSDRSINAGGNPANGIVLGSTSYRVTLDAVGDSVAGGDSGSAGYGCSAGFPSSYAPPQEANGLRITEDSSLSWDPEPSVGTYNLYRGLISTLPAGSSCLQFGLISPSAIDAAEPSAGQTFFYLVTAENRIGEEGTLGWDSSGAERPRTSPCP